jgi:hypothetical protein
MILLLAKLLIARNPALTIAHARRLVTVALAVAGVLLMLGAFALWLHLHTEAAVEADRVEARAEAVSRAREADEHAERAAGATQDSVAASNASAAEAAAASDDPLKAAMDELRRKQ